MSDRPAVRPLPWEAHHLLRACVTLGVSAIGLMIAWWGASGTAKLSSELAWMNLGVAGLVVFGATLAMWLLAGRRALGQRQAAMRVSLEATVAKREGRPDTDSSAKAAAGADALVWANGGTLYHRADCQLVAGKVLRSATLHAHDRARRKACQICLPGEGPNR